MLVQKHLFHIDKLQLDVGETVAASIGYETYGQLSPSRDNAVLICHPFSGTSHAAGRYHEDDAEPGWWDALIGPGRAFDTDQYFIIAVDTLCMPHLWDPKVTTTGPSTPDPKTGLPYGPAFPQVTVRDNVRLQHQLLQSLGVRRLACVAGPSTGGFQALEWAVTYPGVVDRVVAVASSWQAPYVFALGVCQAGIDAIEADPEFHGGEYYGKAAPQRGLARAAHLWATYSRAEEWFAAKWGRKTARGSMHPWADPDGRFAFQSDMAGIAAERADQLDANHYIRMSRAAMLHDVTYGNRSLDVVAQKIKADLLFISVSTDLLFPESVNQEFIEAVRLHGGRAESVVIDSPYGHLAAVQECNRLADPIHRFMSRVVLH